jgi:Domain of unknown function (DUF4333)
MHTRIARTTLAVAVAALGVACTKTLDTSNLQGRLQSELQSDLGSPNLAVHCPGSVKVKAGSTFTCTATGPAGQSLTLLITQKDAKGHVTWKIAGASGGASPTPAASPTS